VLQAVQQMPEVDFDAPCGGAGTCGKCAVLTADGSFSTVTADEKKLLHEKELKAGIRLACQLYALSDCSITLSHGLQESQILHESYVSEYAFTPLYSVKTCSAELPGTDDQRSVLQRIADSCSPDSENGTGSEKRSGSGNAENSSLHMKGLSLSIEQIRSIPADFFPAKNSSSTRTAENTASFSVLLRGGTIMDISREPKEYVCFAADIGTTTIAVYAVHPLTGFVLAFRSSINRQKRFGADVISRIQYVQNHDDGLKQMEKTIVSQLEKHIMDMLDELALTSDAAAGIAVAGNTTMLHLFAGIDPSGISTSPFIPVFTRAVRGSAAEFGFTALPSWIPLQLLPSISSYVGADITAGMFAVGMDASADTVMLLDIGTNGEIALASGGKIHCCSTAAGPAFEGASITFGIGGIYGAVDSVTPYTDEEGRIQLQYTTIGNEPASGICGSAIIDVTAALLETGLADYTGRIDADSPAALHQKHLFTEYRNEPAVIIVPESETALEGPILFTQKDIREVQLAKAAIAAGIETLLQESSADADAIEQLYLAGGFGNYIHTASAVRIGLIPAELADRTISAGNTAGKGTVQMMIDADGEAAMNRLIEKTRYIELSSHAAFQNLYVEHMVFPEH